MPKILSFFCYFKFNKIFFIFFAASNDNKLLQFANKQLVQTFCLRLDKYEII